MRRGRCQGASVVCVAALVGLRAAEAGSWAVVRGSCLGCASGGLPFRGGELRGRRVLWLFGRLSVS